MLCHAHPTTSRVARAAPTFCNIGRVSVLQPSVGVLDDDAMQGFFGVIPPHPRVLAWEDL